MFGKHADKRQIRRVRFVIRKACDESAGQIRTCVLQQKLFSSNKHQKMRRIVLSGHLKFSVTVVFSGRACYSRRGAFVRWLHFFILYNSRVLLLLTFSIRFSVTTLSQTLPNSTIFPRPSAGLRRFTEQCCVESMPIIRSSKYRHRLSTLQRRHPQY